MWLVFAMWAGNGVTEVKLGEAPALFARSAGQAEHVVILVHGGPGSGSAHLRSLEHLASEGLRVVTYDQRGTGGSEAPADPTDYGLDAHVRDLELVRRWTGAEKVTVLGHSWGGVVAMAYAGAHPEHLASVVVVGSSAPNASAGRTQKFAMWEAEADLAVPAPPAELPADCLEAWPTFYSYYADPSRIRVEDLPHACPDDVAHATWRAHTWTTSGTGTTSGYPVERLSDGAGVVGIASPT